MQPKRSLKAEDHKDMNSKTAVSVNTIQQERDANPGLAL